MIYVYNIKQLDTSIGMLSPRRFSWFFAYVAEINILGNFILYI